MSPSPGTVLRTVRHLRPSQVWLQARHLLGGAVRPAAPPATPPVLAVDAAATGFPGAPPHARFAAPGRVTLLDRSVDFGAQIDWDHEDEGPLFAFHLHQHDFLRADRVAPAQRSAVLLDWVDQHREGTGWHPAPISLRALTWLRLLTTPGALELEPGDADRLRSSLCAQLDTLLAHLERRLLANHYFSNLVALVAGSLVLDGPRSAAWARVAPALRAELAEQFPGDGAHYERSAMYHALLFENVLDLLNWVAAAPGRIDAGLEATLRDVASRGLAALRLFVHPDGDLALVGDTALGIAQPPSVLEAYAAGLGVEAQGPRTPGLLDPAGYVRLEAGPFSLLASTAGPSPSYMPGHAHADALSFELCVSGSRVVTDTGVYEYVPGPRRTHSRATAAHATAEVGGHDQAELWGAHRVGGRPRVERVSLSEGRLEATCTGWATPDTRHRRVIQVSAQAVEVADSFEGQERDVRFALPLAAGLEPELHETCARVADLRIELPGAARWRVERAEAYPEFGRCTERAVLVGEAASGGMHRWCIRFA